MLDASPRVPTMLARRAEMLRSILRTLDRIHFGEPHPELSIKPYRRPSSADDIIAKEITSRPARCRSTNCVSIV